MTVAPTLPTVTALMLPNAAVDPVWNEAVLPTVTACNKLVLTVCIQAVPPIPTPPVTTNTPVVVEVLAKVLDMTKLPESATVFKDKLLLQILPPLGLVVKTLPVPL